MFKFGKTQSQSQPPTRLAELTRIPRFSDLQDLLARAQRNSRVSVELPFHTSESPVTLTLVTKVEPSSKAVCWTLYRTDVVGSPILWTQQGTDLHLLENLVELGYTSAVDAKARGEGYEPTSANQASNTGGHQRFANPYLAQLEASGRYTGENAVPEVEESVPAPPPPPQHQPKPRPANPNPFYADQQDDKPEGSASSFEKMMAESKMKKEQFLRAAIAKLQQDTVMNCVPEIGEAVKIVVDPMCTANLDASGVGADLMALVEQHGDVQVALSLVKTFSALLHGRSAPQENEIEAVVASWFW